MYPLNRPELAVPGRVAGLALTLVAALAGSAPAPRAAPAHVHGEALLEVSAAGPRLMVVLRGPAQVFFGFEHPPASADEEAVLRDALAALRSPRQNVFATTPPCELVSMQISSPFPASAARDLSQGNGATSEHEHENEQEHDHAAHPVHADLEAEYTLSCGGGAPDSLTVTAFSAFPELERVEAAWIGDAGGGGAELTPRSPALSLRAP